MAERFTSAEKARLNDLQNRGSIHIHCYDPENAVAARKADLRIKSVPFYEQGDIQAARDADEKVKKI
jgi:hypothetical protein